MSTNVRERLATWVRRSGATAVTHPKQCAEQWGTYWASDLRNTERHLREIDSISMARVEELAREYVERHWDWIRRVAAALNIWRELAPFELEGLRRGQ